MKQTAIFAQRQGGLRMEVIRLTDQHTEYFAELTAIFQEVFNVDSIVTCRQHLRQLLKNPDFIVLAVIQFGEVIGGLTGYVLNGYYSTKPSVYLYDIAVMPECQRYGVGTSLIAALQRLCQQKGYKDFFVQAEADDIEAINFYKSTPISGVINAAHFQYQCAVH